MIEIEVVRGSVLEIRADAIVNAANTAMRGGGALDGAIHRAAGPQMLAQLREAAPGGAETAQVVVTSGFDLPQRYVFHVAGPIWKAQNAALCDELLAASYRNCAQKAVEMGLESLAFPSLSTGVYAFPLERAAPLALATLFDFARENAGSSLQKITFAMFGGAEFHEFSRAFAKMKSQ